MTLPGYLGVALALGLTRTDALRMEISAVFEMVKLREQAQAKAKADAKGGGEWQA